MDALVALIADIEAAKAAGATDAQLAAARDFQRQASSTSTSSSRELERVPRAAGSRADPGEAIDYSGRGSCRCGRRSGRRRTLPADPDSAPPNSRRRS